MSSKKLSLNSAVLIVLIHDLHEKCSKNVFDQF